MSTRALSQSSSGGVRKVVWASAVDPTANAAMVTSASRLVGCMPLSYRMGEAIESCTRALSRNPKNSYHSRFPHAAIRVMYKAGLQLSFRGMF